MHFKRLISNASRIERFRKGWQFGAKKIFCEIVENSILNISPNFLFAPNCHTFWKNMSHKTYRNYIMKGIQALWHHKQHAGRFTGNSTTTGAQWALIWVMYITQVRAHFAPVVVPVEVKRPTELFMVSPRLNAFDCLISKCFTHHTISKRMTIWCKANILWNCRKFDIENCTEFLCHHLLSHHIATPCWSCPTTFSH